MSQLMTIEEIKQTYESRWVYIAETETDENLEVVRGIVRWHTTDREALVQRMVLLPERHIAILHTADSEEEGNIYVL